MKILITGFLGGVGKRLCRYLENYFTLIVSDYRYPDLDIPYEFMLMDITKTEEVKNGIKNVDAIVHLATTGNTNYDNITYTDAINVNVLGTLNLIEAAVQKGIKKFIYLSSCRVYGIPTNKDTIEYFPVNEEHPLKETHPYGLSKIMAEILCRGFSQKYDISVICLRPGAIINTEHTGSIYSVITTKKSLSKLKDTLYTHVDVRDIGQVIKLALKSSIKGFEVFNVVSDDYIFSIDSLDFIQKFYPQVKDIRNIEEFIKSRRKSLVDTTKAKKSLGFKPRYTYGKYLKWIEAGKDEDEYYKII